MPRLLSLLHHGSRRLYRALALAAVAAALVFAALMLALRYWLLPDIENYRDEIAQAMSRAAGQRITIGKIAADWKGLRPHLMLENVAVSDSAGQVALELNRVENTLSWLTLLSGEVRFHSFEIDRPQFNLRRDPQGTVWMGGIRLSQPQAESGFADWLLRQNHVVVRDALISWQDDLLGAPPLSLREVRLHLDNSGSRHRFGLRATPPAQLAAPLDVRGDVSGASANDPAQWRGSLFAQLDYADLAAWRAWLPLPFEIGQGAGALRLWLEFGAARINQATADLHLSGVRTRLREDLPGLNLAALHGRLGWKRRGDSGLEFSTEKLALATLEGLTLKPTDFLLKFFPAHDGKAQSVEIRASSLDLQPLAALADRLPLDPAWRRQLEDWAPRGSLHEAVFTWNGEWDAPQHYRAKARFAGLGIRARGNAFHELSGNLDATEKGGTLSLNSHDARLEFPKAFRDPLHFETLTAQAAWSRSGKQLELKLGNLSFANAHAAGNVYGSYRSAPDGAGIVDLTGNLTRADARFVGRYMPLTVGQGVRDWLNGSILAGHSDDVRLRLKGNLADFPFSDESRGIFQVSVKGAGGVLDYAAGWPRIENIAVDLLFRGKRMEIYAPQAAIFGAKLSGVRVVIPDLLAGDELLQISGEAEGPTAEFLKFIEQSPVTEMIDGFTEGMRAQGRGKLALKLDMPLRRLQGTRVGGAYQFYGNQIFPDPDLPALEQVNGRLEFTETGMRLPHAAATILGGPASISALTQNGSVRITLQGKANMDNLRKSLPLPWLRYLRGTANWRGSVSVRKKLPDIAIESNLLGLASDLPFPFAKAAGDAISLRFEKKIGDARQDRLLFSLGNIVAAQFARKKDGERVSIERGAVNFGGSAVLSDKTGVWVSGALPQLDLDQWRGIFAQAEPGAGPGLAGMDVRVKTLDAFGRRFNDLHLSAWEQSGAWQARVGSREIAGEVAWKPQGKGKVTARLKTFAVPSAAPEKPGAAATKIAGDDLPALDISAESFYVRDRNLGRLELAAVPAGSDWRIEKLHLAAPEANLSMDGLWQTWFVQPHTQVNVKLDVTDIGKFLAHLGYPEGVKRGAATLEGSLSWAGSPQQLDYPSLTGNFRLEAKNGQFAKIEPGIGKLLGILSLQALPRRITLDFKDVFSEGFAFDEIAGDIKITRGVANTENFRIHGPAARVAMNGSVNLAAETQNLRVSVVPAIGESVSLASALLGYPAVGVAALIVQKILKDPLDKLASYEYGITGTWDDPKVEKLQPRPPLETAE